MTKWSSDGLTLDWIEKKDNIYIYGMVWGLNPISLRAKVRLCNECKKYQISEQGLRGLDDEQRERLLEYLEQRAMKNMKYTK